MLTLSRIAYLLIIASLALALYYQSAASYRLWILLSAFLLALNIETDFFWRRLLLTLATVATAVMIVTLSAWFSFSFMSITIFLIALVFAAIYFSELDARNQWSVIIVVSFALIAESNVLQLDEQLTRILYIVSGCAIVVITQLLFGVRFSARAWQQNRTQTLRALSQLSHEMFNCLLDPSYSLNIYRFERRINIEKNQMFFYLQKLRRMLFSCAKKHPEAPINKTQFVNKIDSIYDALMAIMQIRYRVTDHTIFDVCKKELQQLSTEIERIFHMMMANSSEKFSIYNQVKDFEDLYNHVIQVTAREPLVFLIFIANLKTLNDLFESWLTND